MTQTQFARSHSLTRQAEREPGICGTGIAAASASLRHLWGCSVVTAGCGWTVAESPRISLLTALVASLGSGRFSCSSKEFIFFSLKKKKSEIRRQTGERATLPGVKFSAWVRRPGQRLRGQSPAYPGLPLVYFFHVHNVHLSVADSTETNSP